MAARALAGIQVAHQVQAAVSPAAASTAAAV
jgi:hypothetical protein